MPAGCIDSIFRRLDVYHGSNVIEQIDLYNNLSARLKNSQIHQTDRENQWSVFKLQVLLSVI